MRNPEKIQAEASLPVGSLCEPNGVVGKFLPGGAKPLMAMIEITDRCNMACPICFADSGGRVDHAPGPALSDIEGRLDRLLRLTGSPIQIQISGGEPTMRDDLPQIASMAKAMGYTNIELVTNGIRIAREPGYLQRLADAGLNAVYLQFDGLRPQTTKTLRGRDMSAVRHAAVESTRAAGLCCTLAVAVARGVNDDEFGETIRYAAANADTVRAINFQSATGFRGRFDMASQTGFSVDELKRLIEAQAGLPASSFLSAGIGHKECNAVSMALVRDEALRPLFTGVDDADLQDFFGDEAREVILDLFQGKSDFFRKRLAGRRGAAFLAKALPAIGSGGLHLLTSRHLTIFVKSFMECDDVRRDRLDACCYGITTDDGVYSFCAYNNLHRFPLRGQSARQPEQRKD